MKESLTASIVFSAMTGMRNGLSALLRLLTLVLVLGILQEQMHLMLGITPAVIKGETCVVL